MNSRTRAPGGTNVLGNGVQSDDAGDGGRGGLSARFLAGKKGEDHLDPYLGSPPYSAGGGGGAGGRVIVREWGRAPTSLHRFVAPGIAGPPTGVCASYGASEIIEGTSIVTSTSELAMLSKLRCISGDLILRVPGKNTLPLLEIVGGKLIVQGARASGTSLSPTEVQLPALKQVRGDLSLVDNPTLRTFSAPLLSRVDGLIGIVQNSLLSTFSLPITQAAAIYGEANKALTALHFSTLTEIVGTFIIEANPSLKLLDFHNLGHVGGNASLTNNTSLTSLTLSLSPPSSPQTIAGGLHVEGNTHLTKIALPGLTRVNNNLIVRNNEALSTIDFSALETTSGFFLQNNKAVTTISLPKLGTVNTLKIEQNPKLFGLTLGALKTASTFWLAENSDGTDPTLGSCVFPALASVKTSFMLRRVRFTSVKAPLLNSTGNMGIIDCSKIVDIDFRKLARVDGHFFLRDNPKLPNCSALDLRDQVMAAGKIHGSVDIVDNDDVCSPNPCGTLTCTEDCSQANDYTCK